MWQQGRNNRTRGYAPAPKIGGVTAQGHNKSRNQCNDEPDWKRARREGSNVAAPKAGRFAAPKPPPPPTRVIKVTRPAESTWEVDEDEDENLNVEEVEDDEDVFPWGEEEEEVDEANDNGDEEDLVDLGDDNVVEDGDDNDERWEDEAEVPAPAPKQQAWQRSKQLQQRQTIVPVSQPHRQGFVPALPKQGIVQALPKQTASSSSSSRAVNWQGKTALPKAGVKKPARLPEDLGFSVSHGVVRKGWEIGEMEDGIRPSEDGEPDIFLSHSYSDNCRRVDMALFECDCPNSLTCCSHAYAALVALPSYRHRAALLWNMRNLFEKAWVAKAGFEAIRLEIKQTMLQRLPLDDLVDAAIDASLGLWSRVDQLRSNRAPKMDRYWAERVKHAMGADGSKTSSSGSESENEVGTKLQKRVREFLGRLNMNEKESSPLFLALGYGTCATAAAKGGKGKGKSTQNKPVDDSQWSKLAISAWSHIAKGLSAEVVPSKNVSSESVKIAITKAVASVESDGPDWDVLRPHERLWRAEQLTLKNLEVQAFAELRVLKRNSKNNVDAVKVAGRKDIGDIYCSFLEFISDWPECPETLIACASTGDAEIGAVDFLDREAANLLEELGGQATFTSDGNAAAELSLASLLNEHFGSLGDPSDWSKVAARALASPQLSENVWKQAAVMSGIAAAFEVESPFVVGASAGPFSFLATEGCDSAASRLIGMAPPLTELRAWLLWEQVFEPSLGSLRMYLRRASGSIGIGVFELQGGQFIKIDAAAGTTEAWQAALAASDALRAAEALLAFCHGCGSVREASLYETLGPSYKALAQVSTAEAFAALAGEILAELPTPFAQNPGIVKFLLAPIEALPGPIRELSRACGRIKLERAALIFSGSKGTVPVAATIASQVAQRLKTGQCDIEQSGLGARQPPQRHLERVLQNQQGEGTSSGDSVVKGDNLGASLDNTSTNVLHSISVTEKSVSKDSAKSTLELDSAKISSIPSDPAEALVAQIRREEFGFDGEEPTGGELQARQNARLARALKRLAGELYGSDVHWQLELLQNADDNAYEEGFNPAAEFILRDGMVTFRCNETGFKETDIRAICDIGNSSKVGTAKYAAGGRVMATGEKGLGFKAVFALTNAPRIFSGPYRIEFDALHKSGIGYVLPRWLDDGDALLDSERLLDGGWGSALQMAVRPDLRGRQSELFEQLAELPPSSLLFLKKLREVAVIVSTDKGCPSIRMRRSDGDANEVDMRWQARTLRACVEVSRGDNGTWESEKWLLLRRSFEVPDGISKPGIKSPPKETLVEIALPLNADGAIDLSRGVQPVFAFLPVRTFGFHFALQADWAVSSSREELLSGCAWNEFLKARLPHLMVELVDEVKKEPADSPLRWSFYAVIPPLASTVQFFRSAVAQLHAILRGQECMLTDEGTFCLPRLAMRCTPEVRALLAPLTKVKAGSKEESSCSCSPLRDAMRSQGMHFVHEQVETTMPAGLLDSLGVQRFGASHLLRLLPVAAESQPDFAAWRVVMALLDELLDAAPRADLARLVQVAQKLPLLPLEGGSWSAADAGVFLPPAAEDARGFPQALLSELRAVDPAFLADSDGDDALIVARLRKLMKRLGVTALTPRQVLREVVAPMFRNCTSPCKLRISSLEKTAETYLAFSGFIAAHLDLAEELTGPVGWPLLGLEEMIIGNRIKAPMLHSPRAAAFIEALKGTSIEARLPAAPPGLASTNTLSEALERLGLALPGCLVSATSSGDWQSQDFEQIALHCARELPSTSGAARARLIAQSFDASWSCYECYALNAEGVQSTFMRSLRMSAWLPADDIAAENSRADDEDSPILLKPSELCIGTPEIRSIFTETSLLAGKLTTAVSGRFAEALGVVMKPSVALAVDVLRSFGRRSPVGPETAATVYGYLQNEKADLNQLRRSATIVVASGEPALAPEDVIWEDEGGACALPALLPLYHARWRNFFVLGLGVSERPTASHALRRIDQLSNTGSDVDIDALWSVLLLVARRLQVAGIDNGKGDDASLLNERDEWVSVASALHSRRCMPLMGGGVGVPAEGILYIDDCPRVPPRVLDDIKKTASFAATPPSHLKGASHWSSLLRAIGLPPLSEACTISLRHGDFKMCHSTGSHVSTLLPLAQRYLYHRHRATHDRNHIATSSQTRLLQIRRTEGLLQLHCALRARASDEPTIAVMDVDAFLDDKHAIINGEEAPQPPMLVVVGDVPLPVVCVELARLLVPAASEEEMIVAQHAREGLSTFLISVGNGDSEKLCEAIGLGPSVPDDISWGKPDEVIAYEVEMAAAAEAAALKAALASQGIEEESDEDDDPPTKKQRVAADIVGDVEVVPDIDGRGGGEAGAGTFDMVTEGSTGGHKDMGGRGAESDGALDEGLIAEGDEKESQSKGETSKGKSKGTAEKGKAREKKDGADGPAEARGDELEGENEEEGEGKGKNGKGKDGKGKDGKSKGKDGQGKGDGKSKDERDAGDIGDIFSGLPSQRQADDNTKDADGRAKKNFKTRVYDLKDLRKVADRISAPPIKDENNLSTEERQHIGKWGEEFVYKYLQRKLEEEEEADKKRVVWVNEVEETGFQYDVRIEDRNTGEVEAYVEVKTSRARDKHLFEMSYKEWNFAQKEGNRFVIFRVMNACRGDVELISISNPFRQWKELNLGMCLSL